MCESSALAWDINKAALIEVANKVRGKRDIEFDYPVELDTSGEWVTEFKIKRSL
ncbi:hypothetical protein GCM10007938_15530 [Vibrio zhanjiangensis]|uniref:RNA-binding protein n=1 Tax=Vibrio zhanjiangensis TaxID=1046128 RepID=A0ABQ6EYW2_9VIBR|nr:hypothetical protein [Vibrio zhanjiangensis]GLT17775.1 hypothetical protein GCM10007938_15530 [Vibrio zhanjiangensis]